MKTLDKVIKAYECCNHDDRCENCPYTGIACTLERDTDALHYLKTIETTENLYMDELVKKNINYIYNILIEIQDYMQSIYNPNDASEAWILNNINNNINKAIRRIEVIKEILRHQKGHWIDTDNYFYRWECSECGCHTKDAEPNFCPNCGADMRSKYGWINIEEKENE